MPRLQISHLWRARSIHPLLPILLRAIPDLSSARNELRWLEEHVTKRKPRGNLRLEKTLRQLCRDRSRGKPLQYILGSQPFGELDILCRPGVLIPRPGTESYTSYLGNILVNLGLAKSDASHCKSSELRILDLCTGTGCIPLLLDSILSPHYRDLAFLAVDISPKALCLARRNLEWNIEQGHLSPSARSRVLFQHGDILDPQWQMTDEYDLVISNPPYISPVDFARETQRSVRNFEPKLALVPPRQVHSTVALPLTENEGDVFYPRILQIARACRAKMVLMEVDGMEQAQRVTAMAGKLQLWDELQIWRDGLDEAQARGCSVKQEAKASNGNTRIVGQGREIAVFAALRSSLES